MLEAIITGMISGITSGVIVIVVQRFLNQWLNKRKERKRRNMPKCPYCGKIEELDFTKGYKVCAHCDSTYTDPVPSSVE